LIGSLLGLILLPGADSLTAWLLRLPNAQFFESIPLSWLVVVYLLCWTAVASVLDRRQALPAGFAQIEDLVRSSP
jgi:hypothetical protein